MTPPPTSSTKPSSPRAVSALPSDFAPALTLYDRMGGENRINEMTGIFFAEIAKRSELGKFFVNVPVHAIRAHQAKFFKVLFGPEEERPTPDELKDYMIATHVRLFRDFGLDETHFDVVGECFGISLQEMKVPQDQVEEAFEIIGGLRISFEYGAKIARQERKMSSEKKATLPTATMNTMRANEKAILPDGVAPPQSWLVETLGGREEVRKWTCALTYRFMVQDRVLRDTFMLLPYLEMEPYLHNMLEIAFQDYRKDSGTFDFRTSARMLRFPLGLANSMNKVDRLLFDKMERHFEEVGQELIDEGMLQAALKKLDSYKSTMGGSKPIVKTLKGNETAHALKRETSDTATYVTGSSRDSSGELALPSSSEFRVSPKKGKSTRLSSKTTTTPASPKKGVNGIFTWLMSRRQAERNRQARVQTN